MHNSGVIQVIGKPVGSSGTRIPAHVEIITNNPCKTRHRPPPGTSSIAKLLYFLMSRQGLIVKVTFQIGGKGIFQVIHLSGINTATQFVATQPSSTL